MNELDKQKLVIVIRGNIRLYIDIDKTTTLIEELKSIKEHKFVNYGREVFNTADLTGIFLPETLEESSRRLNGEWKCRYGYWHEKYNKCAHGDNPLKALPLY